MKKKKVILIISILIIILSSILIACYITNQNKIKIIKKSFNEFVTTNKEINLYDETKNIIGSISENTYLELENTNIKTKNDTYFKIKNSDYYIYYKDINKTEQKEKIEQKDYYIEIGKKIKTNNPTNLYQDENKITINYELEFDTTKQDDSFYYVNYLNQELKIKKEEIKEEQEKQLNNISTYISIINYENVKEECNIKECITKEQFKEELNYLKENNYYTITIDDYILWLNNNINLKEKAILLTSKDDLNEISKEYNLKIETNLGNLTFTDSNSKSEKGNTTIPRYNIINKTTFETFKQIVDGETITYIELPIIQNHQLPNENSNATEIAVLNYHFFYDPEIGETCPDGNCKAVQDFEKELSYLKQNNYKALTMEEFTKWMYGEIELPARSVLITIDDGALGTGTHNGNKLIPLLEKYQTHATLFLITGWWPIDNYRSQYLDIESHTFDMHEGNYCEGQQRGSKLLCSSKEQVLEDLTKSVEITGSKKAFCFPMYVYNDTTLQVLQEIGFKLAFVGGDYKASRNNNKYQIPRYHIYRETSLDQFINMIS